MGAVSVDKVVGGVALGARLVARTGGAVGRTADALFFFSEEGALGTLAEALLNHLENRIGISTHDHDCAFLPQEHSFLAFFAGVLVAGHAVTAVLAGTARTNSTQQLHVVSLVDGLKVVGTLQVAPALVEVVAGRAEVAELGGGTVLATELAGFAQSLGGDGQVGGSGATVVVANVVVYEIPRFAVDALVASGSPALGATGMAPLTVALLLVSILHGAAEVDAFALVQVEVGVAGQTLVLGGTVATLAVGSAALTDGGTVGPETKRAFGDAGSVGCVVEGQKVEIIGAGRAISDRRAARTSGVALSACLALHVGESTVRTGHDASVGMEEVNYSCSH